MASYVIKLQSAEPCWSPDGKAIAFKNYDRFDIVVIDDLGNNKKLIGTGESPKWMADSQQIIYRWWKTIVRLNVSTMESVLVFEGGDIDEIALSNDGQRVAFIETDGDTSSLCVCNVYGSDFKFLTTTKHLGLGRISWSSNSHWLVCQTPTGVTAFNVKTGERQEISKGFTPSWCPTNHLIAYLASEERSVSSSTLVLYDFKTQKSLFYKLPESWFTRYEIRGRLVWSPNGQFIAFRQTKLGGKVNRGMQAEYSTCILRLHDKKIIKMVEGIGNLNSPPAWRPDSSKLAVCIAGNHEHYLHVIDVPIE